MLQVIQHQKTGEILVEELPAPVCPPEGILVRNHFSLISAGTERASVSNAKSSLLQRARKQPEQVKLVMDYVKKEGIISTYKRVRNTLESFKNLGYSTSGVVLESRCDEFRPGDRVACGGAGYAVHAEIVSVPKNLAVKIPENVDFKSAAYTTLGSIAMQGVRQADPRLGETVAVIGLGLLGQLTVQMLKAAGCRVIGADINERLFEQAKKFGCDYTFPSSGEYKKDIISLADGIGCDAVIITASTSSNEPVELALDICRKKGKVVVVGAVGMNIPRPPFYVKEIDFRISCSYGPGRYDNNYEEKGQDYPPAYVRWTENRNMQAFLNLLAEKKMDVESITTHTFKVADAAKAYDIITGKTNEKFLGILLEYPGREKAAQRTVALKENATQIKGISIGFVGAGVFARSYLLPPLAKEDVTLYGVSTATSSNSMTAAKLFGFSSASTDSSALIKDKNVNTVFCATRHDSHGRYVLEAVEAGKPVFVEKPLAVSGEELQKIDEAVAKHNGRLMVGFNRRFSGPMQSVKNFFENRREPMVMLYRVNAGMIPKSHWIYSPEQGAGRVIGEACHFIDCMVYLSGSLPVRVFAESISGNEGEMFNGDNVIITLKFEDGSTGVVEYLANGDSSLPKEYLEVFSQGSTAVMNNFQAVELYRGGKMQKHKYDGRKGHNEEVKAFIGALKDGGPMPVPYEQLRMVTMATFAANESLRTGLPVNL